MGLCDTVAHVYSSHKRHLGPAAVAAVALLAVVLFLARDTGAPTDDITGARIGHLRSDAHQATRLPGQVQLRNLSFALDGGLLLWTHRTCFARPDGPFPWRSAGWWLRWRWSSSAALVSWRLLEKCCLDRKKYFPLSGSLWKLRWPPLREFVGALGLFSLAGYMGNSVSGPGNASPKDSRRPMPLRKTLPIRQPM